MSILLSSTDPRWAAVALSDLDRTLGDHAHCEKKAAATALKLVVENADRPALVRALAKLAQEETHHFHAVLRELQIRGAPLPPDGGDPYAQGLLRLVRGGAERLLDQLLVGALIEARSLERLRMLAAALPVGRLREMYLGMARAEAGHERLFVDLALRFHAADRVASRLAEMARAEAELVGRLPLEPRIH